MTVAPRRSPTAAKIRPRRDPQRGAVAVAAYLFILVMGAFLAISLNMGIMMDTRAELQNASDAAALAAARSLNGEASGLDAARRAARAYSLEHRAFGQAVQINEYSDDDLTFGHWHLQSSRCTFGAGGHDCFEPIDTTLPRAITAVRIRNGRDGDADHNPSLTLPFGWFIRNNTAQVRSSAVAVGAGSPVTACTLPFAVAECVIVRPETNQLLCETGTPQRLHFSNANNDGIGFINLYYPDERQAPGPPFIEDVIRNRMCRDDNFMTGDGHLQDGNSLNDQILEAIRGVTRHGQREDVTGPCLIGTVQTIAVVDEGCPSSPNFHGVQEVVGFVRARVVAVTDNRGVVQGCPGGPPPAPLVPPAPQRSVTLEILCDAPAGEGEFGGGRAYNSSGVRVRLVQ